MQTNKGIKMPHTYVILFSVILLAAAATYVLPAGTYDRYERMLEDGKKVTLVNPESYHSVAAAPVTPFGVFKAIPKGMEAASNIIFFIFICGGVFSIIQATGAVDAGLGRFLYKIRGYETFVIPLTMLVFSIFGLTMGMSEEVIVFIPVGMTLARALGYDDIVAVAMLVLGASIGFSAGAFNPFTVGVAQSIAELPTFSGYEFRLIGYVLLYCTAVAYTLRYAWKVKANPKISYVYEEMQERQLDERVSPQIPFTGIHKSILYICAFSLVFMVYGVRALNYYITELAALFLAVGVISGLVGRLTPSQIAVHFIKGCKEIVFGALVVGVARAILIVLQDGQVIDTIIRWLGGVVSALPKGFAAIAMFWVQSVINFFVPSGSGQASATMPLMTSLADLLGMTRQAVVTAFHYGDGFSNSIIPTSATLMGILGMARIPYEKWFRFAFPLILIWTVIGSLLCYIAAVLDLGPY